jgi:hypothetical protein
MGMTFWCFVGLGIGLGGKESGARKVLSSGKVNLTFDEAEDPETLSL